MDVSKSRPKGSSINHVNMEGGVINNYDRDVIRFFIKYKGPYLKLRKQARGIRQMSTLVYVGKGELSACLRRQIWALVYSNFSPIF